MRARAGARDQPAVGPVEHLLDLGSAAIGLAAHADQMQAVGILVLHGEMIEDVAVVGVGPHRPRAHVGLDARPAARLTTSRLCTCCSTM